MKKLLFALAIPTALCLSACASVGTAAAVVEAATGSAPIGDRIVMDEKGLYAMEALYNVPANAYKNAVTAKALPPALHARARSLLIQMRGIRNLARTAYKAGDATSWDARIAELYRLKGQVTALIPASK
jgi:hypothetical protein